jgi:hypothetical protein
MIRGARSLPWLRAIVRNRMADGARRYTRRIANELASDRLAETFPAEQANMLVDSVWRRGGSRAGDGRPASRGQRQAIELIKVARAVAEGGISRQRRERGRPQGCHASGYRRAAQGADRQGLKHRNSRADHASGGRHLDRASAAPAMAAGTPVACDRRPYIAFVVRGKLMMVNPSEALADPRFVIEQAATFATALTAAFAAFCSVVPGIDRSVLLLPLAPLAL